MPVLRPKFAPVYGMIILTLLLVAALLFSLFVGRSMTERYAPLADAAMEIKLEAAIGHLWFEEAISGDRYTDLEIIFAHLDQSEWYARAMLDGGENQEGRYVPMESTLLRRQIEETLAGITAFKAIAQERWNAKESSGVGSDIDQRFDQVFANFLASADAVKIVLQKEMGRRLQLFRLTQSLLIVVVLILGLSFAWLLRYHEIRHNNNLQTLQRQEESLRQLRNYLANIIDSMPSVLVGVDREGRVTQWNHEAVRTTGIAIENALGKNLTQVYPQLEDEMGRVEKAIDTRQQQLDPKRARLEQHEVRFEDVTIYPLVANGVEGAVIRVDDVTERVRIEEMMVQSEKMLSVGGLAAGMAHEINNPLAGMMQTASVLANRLSSNLPANEKAAKEAGTSMLAIDNYLQARGIPQMLERIQRSGIRAAEIVTNMLQFARKSGGAFSSHNLNQLLDNTVALAKSDYDLKRKYDFREIEITRNYDPQLPAVPCDASTLQQVILNILRNGAESMWEKKDHPHHFILRTAQEPENKRIRIEIEDNGSGMDEETRKRVFDPFFTTKPVGIGTGLGLSVSYFIICESHKGELKVESQLGEGTTFIIYLPLG